MRKLLIVFCYKYPYEPPTEQFLHVELRYDALEASDIWLMPYARDLDSNASYELINANSKKVQRLVRKPKYLEFFDGIFGLMTRMPAFFKDCKRIILNKEIGKKKALMKTFSDYIQSGALLQQMKKQLDIKTITKYDQVVLYSYWLNPMANAVACYKRFLSKHNVKNVRAVARAHGQGDLYPLVDMGTFRPDRDLLANELDSIYSISDDGISYLGNQGIKNVRLSRLGVSRVDIMPQKPQKKEFTIVSCSVINDNKRVNEIAKAIANLDGEIRWVHFGGGPKETELRKWCRRCMPANVSWHINGWTSNTEVLRFYEQTPPNLFINLSRVEGIPVSIMEAMSFGIPCVATDTGASREIVHPGINGVLLDVNFTTDQVVACIKHCIEMNDEEMRKNAYQTAKEQYCSETNFSRFSKEIWGEVM